MELGQIIFGKLVPAQESELASKGWYRHSEYGVILQQGQDIPQDVGKELMRQYTKGQMQQGAGLFYPTQKETGTYNVATQTYISPTGAKQSMGLEQAKQIGAVIPLPTQTQIQQMPQTARTLLEVKPVYSNGQLTGFNETRLNIESNKPPVINQTNIPAQVIQGQVIPSMTKVNQLDVRDAFTGKTLREQFTETARFAPQIRELPTTISVPQRVTIGGPSYTIPQMTITKAGVLDVLAAPVEIIGAGGKWVTGGFERLLGGEPRNLPIIGTSGGEFIRKIIPKQNLTKEVEVPAKIDIIPFAKTIPPRMETISGQYLLTPKTTAVVPTGVGYIPKIAGFGAELGGYTFVPTSILSPSFIASGIKIFQTAKTPEEKVSGILTAGTGALIGGYGAYKYVTTPFEKSLIVKPAKQVNTGDIVIVPIESKEPLSMFQYRLKSELVPGEQKIIETTKLRDWIGIKPISEKTIPLGKSRITLTKTPFWVSSSEEEATSI